MTSFHGKNVCFPIISCKRESTHIPDIEAVVGIRSVFRPLEQCPLKLHGYLGNRVGRKLDQHLQQVGPHAVLRWLVVDVACQEKTGVTANILVFIHILLWFNQVCVHVMQCGDYKKKDV